jgi:hypothetical protein
LDKTCGSLLQKICQKYDNLDEVDKLASVTKKVDTVKLVMQENVDLALQNCVKLETIERAAGKVPLRLESHPHKSSDRVTMNIFNRGTPEPGRCVQAQCQ